MLANKQSRVKEDEWIFLKIVFWNFFGFIGLRGSENRQETEEKEQEVHLRDCDKLRFILLCCLFKDIEVDNYKIKP